MFFLPHLAKLTMILAGICIAYELLSEETQQKIDDRLSSVVNLRTALVALGQYIFITMLLYGFFTFGAYVMPFVSIILLSVIYGSILLVARSSLSDNPISAGCLGWICGVIVVAIISGIMWTLTAIIPTAIITWCFWPYSQFSHLIHHIDSDVLRLIVPTATGADITDHFEKSNSIIANYFASWNQWPWWLFTKPPLNWLFTVYVQNFVPILIITELILQVAFLFSVIFVLRFIIYCILLCFFSGVDVVRMWFGTSKRRVPVLGILLGGVGAMLDYAAFLVEK